MADATDLSPRPDLATTAARAFLILVFLAGIPCVLADAALQYLVAIRQEATERRHFRQLDQELSAILPHTDPETLLKSGLETLFRRAEARPRPVPYLTRKLRDLTRRFPRLFTFSVLGPDGKVLSRIGGLESRRAAEELWKCLFGFYTKGHFQVGTHLPIVSRYLGLTARASQRLEKIWSGWITTSPGPRKSWFFQRCGPRFSLFANIHREGFTPAMGLRALRLRAARRGIRVEALDMMDLSQTGPGKGSSATDAEGWPPHPESAVLADTPSPEALELAVRFEHEPRKEFRLGGRLWSVAMVNTRWRLVASISPDQGPENLPGKFRAVATAGLAGLFLGLCWLLAQPRLPFLSIRWKLLALFLCSTAGPLILLLAIANAYLGEREDLLIQAAKQDNANLLDEIDLKFPLVTRRWEAELQRLLQANTAVGPAGIEDRLRRFIPFLTRTKAEEARVLASDAREVPMTVKRSQQQLSQKGFASLILSLWRSVTRDERIGGNRLLMQTDLLLSALPKADQAGFLEGIQGNEGTMIPLELAGIKGFFYFQVLRDKAGDPSYLIAAMWTRASLTRRHLLQSIPCKPLDDGTELLWVREAPAWRPVWNQAKTAIVAKKLFPSYPRRPLGRDFGRFFRIFQMKRRLAHETITYKGQPCLVTAFPGRLLEDYSLFALKPLGGIEREIDGMRTRMLGFGLLCSGLACFLGLLLARKFLDPVRELALGVGAVREGDLSHLVPIPDPDELGDLSQVFNEMVESLHEVSMGKLVQERLLPKASWDAAGFQIAGVSRAASQLGGDYFDFLPFGSDRLLVIMADVTGHGIPAALGMAIAKGLVVNHAALGGAVEDLIAALNRVLYHVTPDSLRNPLRMTISLLQIDLVTGEATLFNCGHPYPFRQPRNGTPVMIPAQGMLLGLRGNPRCRPTKLRLAPGDRLIFYSDGLAESLSRKGEDGYDNLGKYFGTRPWLPPPTACQDFLDHHPFLRTGQRQEDDFSVLVVSRNLPGTRHGSIGP